MSTSAAQLIREFEPLPAAEQQEVASEILRRMPAFDSGPLEDEVMARAGNDLAAMLEEEERGSTTR